MFNLPAPCVEVFRVLLVVSAVDGRLSMVIAILNGTDGSAK